MLRLSSIPYGDGPAFVEVLLVRHLSLAALLAVVIGGTAAHAAPDPSHDGCGFGSGKMLPFATDRLLDEAYRVRNATATPLNQIRTRIMAHALPAVEAEIRQGSMHDPALATKAHELIYIDRNGSMVPSVRQRQLNRYVLPYATPDEARALNAITDEMGRDECEIIALYKGFRQRDAIEALEAHFKPTPPAAPPQPIYTPPTFTYTFPSSPPTPVNDSGGVVGMLLGAALVIGAILALALLGRYSSRAAATAHAGYATTTSQTRADLLRVLNDPEEIAKREDVLVVDDDGEVIGTAPPVRSAPTWTFRKSTSLPRFNTEGAITSTRQDSLTQD